jgi:hypothetical protein
MFYCSSLLEVILTSNDIHMALNYKAQQYTSDRLSINYTAQIDSTKPIWAY